MKLFDGSFKMIYLPFHFWQGFANLGFVGELDEMEDDEIDSVLEGMPSKYYMFWSEKSFNYGIGRSLRTCK